MLWYTIETSTAQSLVSQLKSKLVELTQTTLRLRTYDLREIRPEDLGLSQFGIDYGGSTTKTIKVKVNSNSLLGIAGVIGTSETKTTEVDIKKGNELVAKLYVAPVKDVANCQLVAPAFRIYEPDDVIELTFKASAATDLDPVWLLGAVVVPESAPAATTQI